MAIVRYTCQFPRQSVLKMFTASGIINLKPFKVETLELLEAFDVFHTRATYSLLQSTCQKIKQ